MGAVSVRSKDDIEKLAMLCRENITTDALDSFHKQAQILNRYVISEILQSETVTGAIRKELRRLFDGLKITDEEVRALLTSDIIKRDALDGDAAKAAKSVVRKAQNAVARKVAKAQTE